MTERVSVSDRTTVTGGGPVIPAPGEASSKSRRLLYLPIPAKFALALALAIAWTALSVWLSQRWLEDLAEVTNWVFAIIAIAFIAYVPGFMNAFLLGSLLFDRRPPRIRPAAYPPVSVLVAAYNEAGGIRDTLRSLAAQNYPGPFEVLVLNDGSTDDTADITRRAIAELAFAPSATVPAGL